MLRVHAIYYAVQSGNDKIAESPQITQGSASLAGPISSLQTGSWQDRLTHQLETEGQAVAGVRSENLRACGVLVIAAPVRLQKDYCSATRFARFDGSVQVAG
jgi:hypothetical protein